jgi:hypothetical protein
MAANSYTTDDLVSDVELVGHIPLANATFTASKILRLATFQIQTPIMKKILATRGGYYLTYTDYAPVDSGLYDIPPGSVAGALADVQLIQNTTIIPVNIIEPSEQFSTNSPTSTSYGCFYVGNQVQIIPAPNVGNPRLWFTKRTSALVPVSDCGTITGVASNVISVSAVPSDFAVGTVLDCVGENPPFNILGNRTITNIVGTDITLDSAVTGLAIGDFLCLEDQTCVPQIPVEYRILLVQSLAVWIYEIQGYLDKKKSGEERQKGLEEDTTSLITPRIKSQSKVINPVNGGFLSGGRRQTNFPAGHTP